MAGEARLSVAGRARRVSPPRLRATENGCPRAAEIDGCLRFP